MNQIWYKLVDPNGSAHKGATAAQTSISQGAHVTDLRWQVKKDNKELAEIDAKYLKVYSSAWTPGSEERPLKSRTDLHQLGTKKDEALFVVVTNQSQIQKAIVSKKGKVCQSERSMLAEIAYKIHEKYLFQFNYKQDYFEFMNFRLKLLTFGIILDILGFYDDKDVDEVMQDLTNHNKCDKNPGYVMKADNSDLLENWCNAEEWKCLIKLNQHANEDLNQRLAVESDGTKTILIEEQFSDLPQLQRILIKGKIVDDPAKLNIVVVESCE